MTKFNQLEALTLAKKLLKSQCPEDINFLVKGFESYPVLITQVAQLLNNLQGLSKSKYQNIIYPAADQIKANIILAIKQLTPSAVRLLSQLALLNNQKLSKELIIFITDSPAIVDDEIDQLLQLSLIVKVSIDNNHPIFEMHGAVVEKILDINEPDNQLLLEEMMVKINGHYQALASRVIDRVMLSTIMTGMPENVEIILRYAAEYGVSMNIIMQLRATLFIRYDDTNDDYGCRQMIDWLIDQRRTRAFYLFWSNKIYNGMYAEFIGLTGEYNHDISYFKTAINWFTESLEILTAPNNDSASYLKYLAYLTHNHSMSLTISQACLGDFAKAETALSKAEEFLAQEPCGADIMSVRYARAVLYHMQNKHLQALECLDKNIAENLEHGISPDDLQMSINYQLKAESLNCLGKYQQAGIQARQLDNMHKLVKPPYHPIFGFIYTQMARSALGCSTVMLATKQIKAAITILQLSPDYVRQHSDLAGAYLVPGDILARQDNLKDATKSYLQTQAAYLDLSQANRQNVAWVSYLYVQGAKEAYRAKDLEHYQYFSQQQIQEFGVNHHGSSEILQYCRLDNVSLGETDKD